MKNIKNIKMLKLLKILEQIVGQLEQLCLKLHYNCFEFQAAVCSTEVTQNGQGCDHQRS